MTSIPSHSPAGRASGFAPQAEEPTPWACAGEAGLPDRCVANLALLYGGPRPPAEALQSQLRAGGT